MTSNNIEIIVDETTVDVVQAPPSSVSITAPAPLNLEITTGGVQGAVGQSNTLTPGLITTGAAGSSVISTITGTSPNQILNLTIPRGDVGATGPANTLTVGTVTALLPAATPTVGITGTSPTQTINFGIPQGAEWLQGAVAPATGTGVVGDWYINTVTSDYYEKTATAVWTLRGNLKGLTGNTGPANTLTIGTVSTIGVGGSATASVTGTAPNQTLNIGIPTGATGATPTLSTPTITALSVGATPTIGMTGSNPYTFNFGIPAAATWFNGTAPPATGTGIIGDYYLVSSATGLGDVYKKTAAATWTLQGNIRGAAGTGSLSTSGTAVTGNLTKFTDTSGTLIDDTGIASTDVMRLSQTQTIAGAKTFTSTISTTVGGFTSQLAGNSLNFNRPSAASSVNNTGLGGQLAFYLSNTVALDTTALLLTTTGATFGGTVTAGGTGFAGSGANITGVVHTTGAETISGTKTFSGVGAFDAGSNGLRILPGAVDNAYLGIFARTASPGTQSAAIGFTTAASTQLTIQNLISAGNIVMQTTGNGTITLNAGTGSIVLTGTSVTATSFVGSGASLTGITQSQVSGSAPLASPTFTGTVTVPTLAITSQINMASTVLMKNTVATGVGIVDIQATAGNSAALRVIPGSTAAYSLFGASTATFFEFHRTTDGLNRLFLTAPTATASGFNFVNYLSTGSHGPITFGFSSNPSTASSTVLSIGTTGVTVTGTATATSFAGSGASLTGIVDLTTAQTIAGAKTFSSPVTVNAGTSGTPWALNINGGSANDGVAVRLGHGASYPNYLGTLFGTDTYGGLATVMTDNGLQLTNIGGEFRVQTAAANTRKNTAYASKTDATREFIFTTPDADLVSVPPGSTFTVGATTYTVRSARSTGLRVVEDITASPASGTLTGLLYAPVRMTISTTGVTTFTGTVSGITSAMVGLGNVVNAVQVDLTTAQTIAGIKTFSSAPVVPSASWTIANTNGLQAAIDLKANLASPTFTGTVVVPDASWTIAKTSGLQAALDLKSPLASPTFTGTLSAATITASGVVTSGGTGFAGPGVNITTLNATNLSTGTVPQARTAPNTQVFVYSTGSEARPTGTTYVIWRGPSATTPTNAIDGDSWEKVN